MATIARRNLEQAGLLDLVDLRLGDGVKTIAAESDPIDFVLNDIHPTVALPDLKQLAPPLRPGAIAMCRNAALCSLHLPMRFAGEMSVKN